jgi:hypothetical protein
VGLEHRPGGCEGTGGGGESSSELKCSGGGIEEEDEDKEEGDVTPLPHSPPPEYLPSLAISLVSKWGSPLARAGQNGM